VSGAGKVALVTGAARGLGLAAADALANTGAAVALCDVDLKQAQAEADRLNAAGHQALALGNDITQLSEIEQMVGKTVETFGRLDILVNNAGICPRISIDAMTEANYDRIMDTNLKSVFFLSRAAGNAMKANRWGRIINVSSTGGRTGGIFNATVYSASKAGIMSMTKAFARHFAPDGILVNCIAPGTVNTRLMTNLPQESLEVAVSQVPLKRLADPGEIAQVIVFLASEQCTYMTGAIVDVNGGAVMP
jgi:3-oxoacyl-[acyl-carrier protein] reductase